MKKSLILIAVCLCLACGISMAEGVDHAVVKTELNSGDAISVATFDMLYIAEATGEAVVMDRVEKTIGKVEAGFSNDVFKPPVIRKNYPDNRIRKL